VPELPDVERFRRFFARHAAGRTIRDVEADPTILRNATPEALRAALSGSRLEEPYRHGKWLFCPTDGPTLVVHFGMTGALVWSGDEPDRHRWDRLILRLDGGEELRYRNMRKLGGVWLAHDAADVGSIRSGLGPDALGLDQRAFLELLGRRPGGVKAALMDQRFLAGVGNIIADEALWQARIDPQRQVETLSEGERRALFRSLHATLRESIERYDRIPRKRSWLTSVRGTRDAVCPRCGKPLLRRVVAGRTTYSCPRCQR
jgi:formamidopyrimidine-DNA glycosylase